MLTLSEIAAAACEFLNLEDVPTQEQAKKFLRRRWGMLWESQAWPSSVGVEPITPAPDRTATLPDAVALVMQVTTATGTVLPPEAEVARRLMDDGMATESGRTPSWRESSRTATGAPVLTFSRAFDAGALPLTAVVKRTAPAFTADGDRPVLPGADLALIAHVTADLYEWQQSMSLANAKRAEAVALEQRMLDQAVAQSGHVARIIPWD